MKLGWITFIMAGMLSACVTINIYFPAAAANKAADKIIDDVWQLKDTPNQSAPTTAPAEDATPAPK